MTVLGGVIPVLSTPFDGAERVDEGALAAEIGWILGCGVDGIAIAMVSEILRLDVSERERLAESVCSSVAASVIQVPVVVGVGAEATVLAVRLARHAEGVGASAVIAAPPVTTALDDDELLDYFAAVLDATTLPVVVQDASGYVGQSLTLDLSLALLDGYGERVWFKPEAQPLGPRLSRLHQRSGGRARVFEGSGGGALVDAHARGIVGTMPGPEAPWALVAMWSALEAGDHELARRIAEPLTALLALQTSLDSYVAVEKHLLVRQGVFGSTRQRGPVGFALDPQTEVEVDRLMHRLRRAVETGAIPAATPGRSDLRRRQSAGSA